CQQYNDWISF
nr:immunoglobulin light chain junction region [Macaca mulatta]MOX51827.1 immunoglobulin light chain junction region [Macaca mulatta]MOX52024.1 immunoglobulin light chain junction region [Macaca mulatta]MOX52509.1 immunoglobulin light chain junction region [Macaca mulatta]MOX52812.1 immunoglobulin light chain junction region [Macaca mulatta]